MFNLSLVKKNILNEKFFLLFSVWLVLGSVIVKKVVGVLLLDFSLGMLFLMSLFVYFKYRKSENGIEKKNNVFLRAWVVILLFILVSNVVPEVFRLLSGQVYSGRVIGHVERYVLLFLFLFVVYAFVRVRILFDDFIKLLLFASLWVSFVILYEFFFLRFDFSSLTSHRFGSIASSGVIDFGVYSNILFVILVGSAFNIHRLSTGWRVLWFLFVALDFLGVLLSQSRTAWIGWPEAIIGWGLFYYACFFNKRRVSIYRVFLYLLIFVLFFSPFYIILKNRVSLVQHDIYSFESGNPLTSLGMRMLMYKIGVEHVPDNLMIGMGVNNFRSFLESESHRVLHEEYGIENKYLSFSHIHNQFLMSLLTEGALSLLSLLIMFGFMFLFFLDRFKSFCSCELKYFSVAGMVFSIVSFLSFMPESPLTFKSTFVFFFLVACLLFSVNLRANNER